MNPIIAVIFSIFLMLIWLDYFRLINVFGDKERIYYYVICCVFGAISFPFVEGLFYLLHEVIEWNLSRNFIVDLLYSFVRFGILEQMGKLLAFFVCYLIFEDQFKNPIDYIINACMVVIGYSIISNALFFIEHGAFDAHLRVFVFIVIDMFHFCLIIYGFICYKYKTFRLQTLISYTLISIFCHGFLNFWFIYPQFQEIRYYESVSDNFLIIRAMLWMMFQTFDLVVVFSILYILIIHNIFSIMIENSLNNSINFNYKKYIYRGQIVLRFCIHYVLIFCFIYFIQMNGSFFKQIALLIPIFFATLGLYIVPLMIGTIFLYRLSSIQLIHLKWTFLKISFWDERQFYSDRLINDYLEKNCRLIYFNKRTKLRNNGYQMFLEKKLYDVNDEFLYIAQLFKQDSEDFERVIIRPKKGNTDKTKEGNPIVLMYQYVEGLENRKFDFKKIKSKFRNTMLIKEYK